MDINVLGYTIYLAIMVLLILRLGKRFHREGRIFILNLYGGDPKPTDAINNLLLTAYYLFNTGYAFQRIRSWQPLTGYPELIAAVTGQLGLLVLILAVSHYVNMLAIYLAGKGKKNLVSPKNKLS